MAFCLFCTHTCYIIHVHGSMAFYIWYKLLSSTLARTYVEGHAGVCLCVCVYVCNHLATNVSIGKLLAK